MRQITSLLSCYFICISGTVLGQGSKSLTWITKRVRAPQPVSRLEPVLGPPEPLERRSGHIPLRKALSALAEISIPAFPKGSTAFYEWLCTGGKGLWDISRQWLWMDTNSTRSKMSVWSTSQTKGLWRSGAQWSFGLGLSHSGSRGSILQLFSQFWNT